MSYTRKTRDEWEIQGYLSGEWETETTEETRKDAIAQLRCYRANVTYPMRMRKVRVSIIPVCAQAMGCLCAGHARGNSAALPCDTRETA